MASQSALNNIDASEGLGRSEQEQEQEQTNGQYPKIALRGASNVITGPVPPNFLFLESPSPPTSYRIYFRHPGYPDSSNVLLALNAWDGAGGSIHYGLAHTACAIIANNRFDGYLSVARDGSSRLQTEWDTCLPAIPHGYYFHVPPPPENQAHTQTPPSYRWPFVPSFLDWRFPHLLPGAWQKCVEAQLGSNNAAQSDQTGSIRQRDVVCRVSAHITGTEMAHLIPVHESRWFKSNSMGLYNGNPTLDTEHLLRDSNNALLLRADLHKAFDDRKFMFFPKDDQGFTVHILGNAPDLRLIYHNTRVNISQCETNYLFARFAWTIFPFLSNFLTATLHPRLVVRWDEASEDIIESEVSTQLLARMSVASRSNSPTKRSKMASSNDEHLDNDCAGEVRGRKRTFDAGPANDDATRHVKNRRLSSGRASLSSEDESADGDLPLVHLHSQKLHETVEVDNPEHGYDASAFNRLRREALIRQRPAGYFLPPYDKHRDGREEMEIMGVEIIDDLSDEENDFI